MITYPIIIQRPIEKKYYSNKKNIEIMQDNNAIDIMEKYINNELFNQKEPIKTYFFYDIARECGISVDVVNKYGPSIDCGSNGFTAVRKDLAGTMTHEELNEYY